MIGSAAAETYKNGLLAGFISGGYPTASIKNWVHLLKFARYGPGRRLLQRQENVPDALVHPLWLSEFIIQASAYARALARNPAWFENIDDCALRLYAWQAARIVRDLSATIYHYRSGYGHQSVQVAKQKGMVTLCDHSIAHPSTLDYLIAHGGKLPPPGQARPNNRMWNNILKDIDQADCVVVNSDFVKDTFVHCGYDPSRIVVLYSGVAEDFLRLVPKRVYPASVDAPIRLLFVGDLGVRKGGEILLQALSRIRELPWQFEAIGSIEPRLRDEFRGFLSDPRVTVAGYLTWAELAQRMSAADIFVFPSFAEGSARVVFQAMACGCYVITTPNSGSIVENGVHGRIVPPGDIGLLVAAIRIAIEERDSIGAIGRGNAEHIRRNYTQEHYGRSLIQLYNRLMNER